MNTTFGKRYKIYVILICVFICTGFGIYILSPRIDSILFQKKVGTLNKWEKMCSQGETSFLSYDIPDSGETTQNKFHRPKKTDFVFSFDGVVKIDDGLYITGIRGLTNWGMMIRIYSRKNITLETPKKISGEYKTWNFYLTSKGSENSDFPHQENSEMLVENKLFSYPVTTYLATPNSINEDGTLTLLYHSGKNYKDQKEIQIDVKQLQLNK